MPSNTAGGLPYPLDTEAGKLGAVSIQNLAVALDSDPDEITLYRAADLAIPNGVWTKVTWTGATRNNGGTCLAVSGTAGVKALVAGRYWIQGWYWATGTNGRRFIGFDDTAASSPPSECNFTAATSTIDGMEVAFGCPITLAVNQIATMFVWQDQGSTITSTANTIGMTIYRLRR